ncbi:hypothetical protein key_076 [Erwinia phage KEY]|uniref:Uncharacterized protein n=2 Tax=Keyvirus TaxID=3152642 RepID=A0AAE8BDQ0_9CAUD|nr:hypothetical protein AAS21_gp076 [Pantoea phage vB_PagS_AAS21]QYC51567.1 hypothetical protein key_076 [Erwinia phage KEY]
MGYPYLIHASIKKCGKGIREIRTFGHFNRTGKRDNSCCEVVNERES